MITKFMYFLTMIAAVGLATSCSKQVEQSATQGSLAGTWQWVRTDGGLAYHIHETPSTTGKNIDLKLTADGTYEIITNGAATSSGTYILETRKCIHDGKEKRFINFSLPSDGDFMIESVDGEQLQLSDEAYDGIGRLYARKGLQEK